MSKTEIAALYFKPQNDITKIRVNISDPLGYIYISYVNQIQEQ